MTNSIHSYLFITLLNEYRGNVFSIFSRASRASVWYGVCSGASVGVVYAHRETTIVIDKVYAFI